MTRVMLAVFVWGAVGCTGEFTLPEANQPPRCGERPRLWRLSTSQFQHAIGVLLGGRDAPAPATGFIAPFGHERRADLFTTWAGRAGMEPGDFDETWAAAEAIAKSVVTKHQAKMGHCTLSDQSCVRTLLDSTLEVLWSRPPAPEELDDWVEQVTSARADRSAEDAMIVTLREVLMSPGFLFRTELGEGGLMTSYEVAAALAYGLTEAPPDLVLWQAAQADALRTPEEVQAQLDRLTATPEELPALRRFVREYLQWDSTVDVPKDPTKFPWHLPSMLAADSQKVVDKLTQAHAHQGLLRALLTSDEIFVRADTAKSWGVADMVPAEGAFQHQAGRSGVLTHPSWLSGMSENNHNHLVRRGRFIRERLLCGQVPNLPAGAVPAVPELPNMTFRQRVEQHSQNPSCWACHQLMDPLGYAFEAWDHTGRPQSMDNGAPVATNGTLVGADERDGAYTDAADLMERLANSETVQRCFVTHLFRFVRGRPETEVDACELDTLTALYRDTGEDTVAVLNALYATPTFLERPAERTSAP